MSRLVAFVALCSISQSASASEPVWHTNLDTAQQIAAEQGKDLFVNFTGTTWCHHCIQLEYEILNDPAFATAAEAFILVELDFPSDVDDLPDAVRDDFIRWRDRYGVEGFPTVLLTDSAGRPYAMTGYEPGGAKAFLANLEVKRQAHDVRDAEIAKAKAATGLDKARHLAAALAAVQNACAGEWLQCHGDGLKDHPLVRFYRDEIDAIVSLDTENTAGLKAQYDALLLSEQQRQEWEAVLDRIDQIRRDDGTDAALAAIAEELERTPAGSRRNSLRFIRRTYLEWADRYEEALAESRKMAVDESFPIDERRALQNRVAFNLWKLDRIDESTAVHDELIAEVLKDGDRGEIWRCRRDKAQMLTSAGRFDEALQTWEAAAAFVEPGTIDWFNNEIFRARLLEKLERYDEAVAVYEAVRPHYTRQPAIERAFLDAQSARAMAKAGDKERAKQRIESAESFLKDVPADEHPDAVERVRKMLADTREAIARPAQP